MLSLYIWKGVPYVTRSCHNEGGIAVVATYQSEAAVLADMACGDPHDDYSARQQERMQANGIGWYGKSGVEKRAERLEALLHVPHDDLPDDESECRVCDTCYELELRVIEIDPSLRGAWVFANNGCC